MLGEKIFGKAGNVVGDFSQRRRLNANDFTAVNSTVAPSISLRVALVN